MGKLLLWAWGAYALIWVAVFLSAYFDFFSFMDDWRGRRVAHHLPPYFSWKYLIWSAPVLLAGLASISS